MTAKMVVHVIDDDDAMRDSLAFLLDVQGFSARLYESAAAFLGALPIDPETTRRAWHRAASRYRRSATTGAAH